MQGTQFTLVPLLLALTSSLPAQTLRPKDAARELATMYADDQRDQTEWETAPERENEFAQRQLVRRARVIEILNSTELDDLDAWDHAAGLLLHGDVVGDFLLSHVLAVPPAAEGAAFGRFTTAAALDRYLVLTGREQIFGTQFTVERPGMVTYEEYPEHFVPEHLRQLFEAGPRLRVEKKPGKTGERPPRVKELKSMAKKVAAIRDPADVSPEYWQRARAVIYGNEDLDAADLLAAAQILITSQGSADLLLAHVCALGSAFGSKRKARGKALALGARTLDTWLASIGEAPRFSPVAEGEDEPDPPLPPFVVRHYQG